VEVHLNFIAVMDKLEAGADLVKTISSNMEWLVVLFMRVNISGIELSVVSRNEQGKHQAK